MNKTPDTMTRDEIRSAIALKVLAHTEAPRGLNLYSDFFTAPTSTRAGRKNNFAIWTRGCSPELVAELRALCDRLDALDAASEAASALGRLGGSSTSPAKRAAVRANGAKGGRPAWRVVDRWDVDADGAEDMLVRDERTGRRVLLCRRHNLGAADPATWCVAFDAAGVADVRASVAASGEHISQIALAPLAWDADAAARVARAAERNA